MIGGVGQRLLTTVAKRTAGEFFTAVDEVLQRRRSRGGGRTHRPRRGGRPLSGVGDGGAPARAAGGGAGPRVYTAPARRGAPGIPGGEFAAGVALGAAAALLGALVGGYLARRARGR